MLLSLNSVLENKSLFKVIGKQKYSPAASCSTAVWRDTTRPPPRRTHPGQREGPAPAHAAAPGRAGPPVARRSADTASLAHGSNAQNSVPAGHRQSGNSKVLFIKRDVEGLLIAEGILAASASRLCRCRLPAPGRAPLPAPRGPQTMDSVSTGPCGPSLRDSRRTVGFSPPPSPGGGADRPFCSSLASSDTSG